MESLALVRQAECGARSYCITTVYSCLYQWKSQVGGCAEYGTQGEVGDGDIRKQNPGVLHDLDI